MPFLLNSIILILLSMVPNVQAALSINPILPLSEITQHSLGKQGIVLQLSPGLINNMARHYLKCVQL